MAGTSPLPENTSSESVAWITANAADVLADQQRRGESLQTRAAQIAGFGGATVALAGGLIDKIAKAGDVAQGFAIFFLIAAVVILGSSIYYAVLKVLKPVSRFALSSDEVANYLTDERFVTQAPQEIQFRTLKGISQSLETYEKANDDKAKCLKKSAYRFLIGVGAVAGLVLTLGIDAVCR